MDYILLLQNSKMILKNYKFTNKKNCDIISLFEIYFIYVFEINKIVFDK